MWFGEALTLAYGPEVAGDMFNFADTARTMRTISDMKEKGMLTATNEKLILGLRQDADRHDREDEREGGG